MVTPSLNLQTDVQHYQAAALCWSMDQLSTVCTNIGPMLEILDIQPFSALPGTVGLQCELENHKKACCSLHLQSVALALSSLFARRASIHSWHLLNLALDANLVQHSEQHKAEQYLLLAPGTSPFTSKPCGTKLPVHSSKPRPLSTF